MRVHGIYITAISVRLTACVCTVMKLSTLQIMQHEMVGQRTRNNVDGSGPELFKPFECYVPFPQNTHVAVSYKYSYLHNIHYWLIYVSWCSLVKYHALHHTQGLRLSELSASHKILWKNGKLQISGNNTSKITFVKELNSSLKSGNTCYSLVQNHLFSSFLFKNIKINVCRSAILPVILYGLREEYRLRVFEIRVLRKLFGPKRDKLMEMVNIP